MSDLAWRLLTEQMALGPRFVGSEGHRRMHAWLDRALADTERHDHTFEEHFLGVSVVCRTFVARFPGARPGRLLLGTHYDTRPHADCDPDPARRRDPVPGANDGASGTAVLLALRSWLEEERDRPTVDLVFFDAEDWHGIDGKEVSLGAERYVRSLSDRELPDAALIFDMVAGRGQRVQFDLSVHNHPPSVELSVRLHRIARELGLASFRDDPAPTWVYDDHSPFLERHVPCCLLIDMDYEPWHTVADDLDACDPTALAEMVTLARDAVVKIALTPRSR